MKLLTLALLILFPACASNPQQARYGKETNAPKFSNTRSFVEKPEMVRLAARAVLDDLMRASDPPATGALKGNEEFLRTGWVYSVSKDKYVEFTANGVPQRKPLRVRRRYGYAITPNLSGSQVVLEAEEEVIQLDFQTGTEKGWKGAETDPAVYDLMTRRLKEKLREL